MLGLSCHDEYELTTWLMGYKVGYNLLQRTAHTLFVNLGDFAAGTRLTVRAKHLGKLLQGFQYSIG